VKNTRPSAAVAAVITVLLATSLLGSAAAQAATSPEDAPPINSVAAEFQTFAVEHPWDFKAQDNLAMKLFGHHVMVAFDGSSSATTGTEAAKIVASGRYERQGAIRPMAMPSDLFAVARSTVDVGTGIVAVGSWQFKSSRAGQAAP